MPIPTLNEEVNEEGGIFVPDEIAKELNMLVRDASCVERLARHIPMKRKTMTRRLQTDGVQGYWVGGMEVKPKDAPEFGTYTLTAEKLAVIVPIEDELLDDADSDIAAIVNEDVVGAFAENLDAAFLGYDPTSPFTMSISGNVPADHIIPHGTSGEDLVGDWSLAMAAIEAHGYEVTGAISHPAVKHYLRDLRDDDGRPLFAENFVNGVRTYTVFGVPICFTRQVPLQASPKGYEILLAYWPYVFVGDRSGLKVSISTEATLTQGTESPINLWEQDMSALRFVIRKAFTIKRPECVLAKITGVPPIG